MSEFTTPMTNEKPVATDPTHDALSIMSHDKVALAGVVLVSTAMLTMVSTPVGVLLLVASGLGILIHRLDVALKSASA
ncbi:MAG: hypothetical protein HIU84_14185 [Acidobacteria bacterium]|nr:hypothetical protein [Acidobacteriota bacterium]